MNKIAILIGFLVFMLFGCASHHTEMVDGIKADMVLPLEWLAPGKIDLKPELGALSNAKVAVFIYDGRAEQVLVGHAESGDRNVATKDNIEKAYENHICDLFKEAGLQIDNNSPTITIDITIKSLFVEEAGLYNGQMTGVVNILKNGTSIWSNNAEGKSKRWGRSFKDENYNETLTSTIVDFVDKLTNNKLFIEELAHNL